jgi:hypothetical protein
MHHRARENNNKQNKKANQSSRFICKPTPPSYTHKRQQTGIPKAALVASGRRNIRFSERLLQAKPKRSEQSDYKGDINLVRYCNAGWRMKCNRYENEVAASHSRDDGGSY